MYKKSIINLLTWLLAVPLLWGGCDKQKNCPELELPPLTTEGRNIFGCKIDGEVWVPHTGWQLIQTPLDFGEITVEHFEDENAFYIRVDRRPNGNCDTTDQVMHLGISLDSLNSGKLNYSSGLSASSAAATPNLPEQKTESYRRLMRQVFIS